MWSDNDLWFPTQLTARYRLRAGNKAPTYIYRFDAETEYNVGREIIQGVELYRHPSHGDDSAHLFNSVRHKNFAEINERTRNTVEVMTSSFVNFAAFGDPSVPELGIHWPAVSSEDELLMGLNIHEKRSEVMEFPESKRMHVFTEIWDAERGDGIDENLN
jgi:carboxylesterase type B